MVQLGKSSRIWSLASCLGLVVLCGCGGSGDFRVAAVSGRVTCNGQPVKGGSVMFSPIAQGKEDPGKAASGMINENGEFRLSTYGENDGAVIGKHRVSFSSDDPYNFPCGQPGIQELDVVAGKNEFNIELTPKK